MIEVDSLVNVYDTFRGRGIRSVDGPRAYRLGRRKIDSPSVESSQRVENIGRARVLITLSISLLVLAVNSLPVQAREGPPAWVHLAFRSPILIEGDAAFTPENGVVGGTGTLGDPYVIEGWDINASSSPGVEVRNTTASFVIRNLSVHDSRDRFAIIFANVSNGQVERSNFTRTWGGVYLVGSENITLDGNRIVHFIVGTQAERSSDVVIRGNEFLWESPSISIALRLVGSDRIHVASNNLTGPRSDGLLAQASTNLTVSGNIFNEAGVELSGSLPAHFDSHVIGSDNLVKGRPVYYFSRISGLRFAGASPGQLILANCSDVQVAGLALNGSYVGATVVFSEGVRMDGIVITDALAGIRIARSRDITLANTTVARTVQASLAISSSEAVRLDHVNLSESRDNGLRAVGVAGLRIEGSLISRNTFGLSITSSSDVELRRSDISLNDYRAGVELSLITNLTVEGNEVSMNGRGDPMGSGIRAGFSTNVVIGGNNVSYNGGPGISAGSFENLTIQGNDVSFNNDGISVGGRLAVIADNLVRGSSLGLRLDRTEGSVTRNIVEGNWRAAELWQAGPLNFSGNRFASNTEGVLVIQANNVTFWGNEFADRQFGISISESVNVGVVRNVFRSVDSQVSRVVGSTGLYWDGGYPTGGNYWVDYAGNDSCSGPAQDVCNGPDGIGDSPYVIDGLNQDRYPFTWDLRETTPPQVLILSPPGGSVVDQAFVRVLGAASDAVGGVLLQVEVRVDEGAWLVANGTSSWSMDVALRHGANRIDARALDRAGNPSPVASVTLVYDLAPMARLVVTPATGTVGTVFVVDTTSAMDLDDPTAALVARLDWESDGRWDTDWAPLGVTQHVYAASGTYRILVEVRDPSGVSAYYVVPVVVTPLEPSGFLWPAIGLGLGALVVAAVVLLLRRRRRFSKTPRGPQGTLK